MNKRFLFWVCLLSVALLGSWIFFCTQDDRRDLRIIVGSVSAQGGNDFSKSKALQDSEDIHTVVFSLIHAESYEPDSLPDRPADAVMMISAGKNHTAFFYYLWLEQDNVIVTDAGDLCKIVPKSNAAALQALIQRELAL